MYLQTIPSIYIQPKVPKEPKAPKGTKAPKGSKTPNKVSALFQKKASKLAQKKERFEKEKADREDQMELKLSKRTGSLKKRIYLMLIPLEVVTVVSLIVSCFRQVSIQNSSEDLYYNQLYQINNTLTTVDRDFCQASTLDKIGRAHV